MRLARVVGSVVSTIKHTACHDVKLLVLQAVGLDLQPKEGRSWIAVDAVGAGVGETVLACDQGRSAAQVLQLEPPQPVRSVIVGIVDRIDTTGAETVYSP